MNFFHAMALHPEAQTKAQAELDAVVGRDRLPDFNDRDNLPYVDALLRETLRWQVITPFGELYLCPPQTTAQTPTQRCHAPRWPIWSTRVFISPRAQS
jgi:cytochrome P450